jgi:integrase
VKSDNRAKLDFGFVDSLKAPRKGYVVWYDTVEPDLGIRVNAGGRKTWFGMVEGERPTIGKFPTIKPPLARKKLIVIQRRVLIEERTPREAAAERKAEPTLQQAFDAYRHKRFVANDRKPRNVDSMFDLYLKPWARARLSEITPGQVEHLHRDIPTRKRRRWRAVENPETGKRDKVLFETEQNCKGAFADHVLGLIKSIYSFARSYYPDGSRTPFYTGPNPADGIEKHGETPPERRLRHDEIKRFFAALIAEPDRDFRDWVLVSLWTGARSGNTRAMRWPDIDLDAGEWSLIVRKGRPKKSGESRKRQVTIALASAVIDLLRTRQATAAGDWVFPAKTRTGHMGTPKKPWSRLLTRAKVKNLRMHDLRHSAASWAAESGASGPLLQAILAHSDPKMSARYTHMQTAVVRDAADAMANLMLEKAGVTAAEITKH